MNVTQIVAFALVSTFIIVLLKQYKSEYAFLATIVAGGIILFFSFSKLEMIITLIENLINKIGIDKEFFEILLKITGIAYLIDFGANVCKDAGESAIASKIEFAGKLIIVTMSIPILTTLIETVTEVI
ncbi:MAG: stage III sporulation protein AD [Clostridia bacterium]|nr:stage III sporulation protein AD [Clostridia bacterium]